MPKESDHRWQATRTIGEASSVAALCGFHWGCRSVAIWSTTMILGSLSALSCGSSPEPLRSLPELLVIARQPSSTALSGVAFGQQPLVQLRDAAGNNVPQSGIWVGASIASGGGTLGGASTVRTNANGEAAFADLSISGLAGQRTLQFAASGLTPVVSSPVSLMPGGRIVYSARTAGGYQLFAIGADGSGSTQLTNDPSGAAFLPTWAPDRSQVAYVAFGTGDSSIRIAVISADGSGRRFLTQAAERGSDPAWSPRGDQIAYASSWGHSHIYIMSADGTNKRQLTSAATSHLNPAWSPTAAAIAYVSRPPFSGWPLDLYVMNPDGTGQTRLTTTALGAQLSTCAWSPDGTRIVLERDSRSAVTEPPNWDVYVISADGSGLVRLTTDPALDSDPCWSPDGAKIVFVSNRGSGDLRLYTMNPDGSAVWPIPGAVSPAVWPAWR